MKQRYSANIGIVGGLVDLATGLIILQGNSAMMPSGAMMFSPAITVAYFLLALGVVVLLTGVYLFVARSMINAHYFGPLMILYGAVMLVLGVGMIGQMFSMMQGSFLSGSIMLLIGVAMLYSGFTMGKM